jgi:hypothetical protein
MPGIQLTRKLPVLVLVLAVLGLGFHAAAQEADSEDSSIFFSSNVSARYVYSDEPHPLGVIDQIRFTHPFADFTTGIEASNGLGVSVTGRMLAEYRLDSDFNIPFAQPGNPVAAENNIMLAGILYAPLWGGSISLGRQKVEFGKSRLSGLQIDTHVPFLDSVMYTLPIGKLEITQVIATLENHEGIGDLNPTWFLADDGYDFGISDIIVSSRRFSWKEERFTIGIGAQALFSRPYNAFQLGDFLPIFSVHNANVGSNNFSLLFDFELNAIPEHTQYLVLGLDDINAGAVGINDSGIPTIWAVQGGVSGTFHLASLALDYRSEAVATHYLWGSFHNDPDMVLSRAIYRIKTDGGVLLFPLTSPFGPGRLSFEAETTLRIPGWLDIGLAGLLLYGDPAINLTSTTYAEQDVNYEFMLLRLGVSLARDLGAGLRLSADAGGDLLPGGFYPRLGVTGSWRFEAR